MTLIARTQVPGIDGESYVSIDWARTLPVLLAGTLTCIAVLATCVCFYEAGRADTAALATTAFEREAAWRELLLPVVENGEEALAIVERHDSAQAAELRSRIPVDVRALIQEAQDP